MSSIGFEEETKLLPNSIRSAAIPQPIGPDDNTYAWSVGFGNLAINETAGLDKIVLNGVLPADVRFEYDGSYNLIVHISAENITVAGQFYSYAFGDPASYDGYQVESLVYGDGTEISLLNNLNFTGTGGGEYVYGVGDDNTLRGLGGDDSLYGYEGNDTLEGGEGADYLYGGLNDDTYVWSVGDGNDTVTEVGGLDKVVLTGVLPADVRFFNDGGYGLIVHIGDEKITIDNQFLDEAFPGVGYEVYQVETLVFGDGTEVSLLNNLTFTGTGDSETVYGVGDDNVLRGLGGDDYLYGYEGNDTLEGGEGADYLYGGLNDDTYVWSVGDGNDYISEEGGLDRIVLNGVLPADVRFERDGGYSLIIHIGDENITVANQFYEHFNPGSGGEIYQVESLVYGDGTEISLLNNLTFTGTGDSENVYGVNDDNTLRGLAGDDYLYGYKGSDTLEGGEGADDLYGGLNDDTYVWSVGDGNDYIQEEGGLDKIVLNGVLPADVRFESVGGYGLIVHIGTENITIGNQFYEHYAPGSGGDIYQVESLVYGDGTEISLLQNLTFTGTSNSENVYGLNDDNILRGLGGDDGLYGGLGDDTYAWSVGDGNDYIQEEGGLDKIVLNSVLPADVRFENNGGYTLIVHIGSETITIGSQFYEHFAPGSGGDIYQVESLVYGDGSEISLLNNLTFTGTDNSENVLGLKDDNILRGLGGDDYLYGYEGNDTLKGGEGADYLVGDTGVDLFVLDNLNGVDTIADYEAGEKIDVSAIFSGVPGFHPALAFSAGFLRVADGGAGVDVYVDTDGSAGANPEQLLAQVYGTGYATLGIEDFILPEEVPNTNPVAQDDWFTGLEDVPVTGNLLADNGFGVDSDVDGDTLSVLPETITTFRGALVTLHSDGTFLYTPLPNAYGNDKFNYTLLDGHGGFDSGKAIITLTNVVKPVVALSLDGGDDNSNLIGTYLNDTLHGNGGDDVLFGLSGADKLYGGDGEDILYGGKSSDLLSGGAHADTFILDGITNRIDTITDFNVAEGDHLQVRDILSFDPLVDAISDFIHITQTGANSFVSVDADGTLNGENFVNVARLNGVTGLDVNQLFADGDIVIQQQIV